MCEISFLLTILVCVYVYLKSSFCCATILRDDVKHGFAVHERVVADRSVEKGVEKVPNDKRIIKR